MNTVVAGFVPLVDAAVLVAAKELGFDRAHGFVLELVKQPSWASLRDHLNLGYIDCAHALAPLPIASALGVGQVESSVEVPFVLGRGGNAISVARTLADELRRVAGDTGLFGAARWGQALKTLVAKRSRPLTLAMVYPFSGHNFELRYWLAAAGIHPDRDVRLVAIPPPLMVASLRAGQVDGFCVGEPWNSLAAAEGVGEIIVSKSEIFPRGIEKVLAMPAAGLADTARTTRLLECLRAAAEWCDAPENHAELVSLLARPDYLGVAPEISFKALAGELPIAGAESDPEFLYFARRDANRPRTEEALWIYAQMRRWGQVPPDDVAERRAARVFRSDVYDVVFGVESGFDTAPIAACDAVDFDGKSVARYLERFRLSTPFGEAALEILPD